MTAREIGRNRGSRRSRSPASSVPSESLHHWYPSQLRLASAVQHCRISADALFRVCKAWAAVPVTFVTSVTGDNAHWATAAQALRDSVDIGDQRHRQQCTPAQALQNTGHTSDRKNWSAYQVTPGRSRLLGYTGWDSDSMLRLTRAGHAHTRLCTYYGTWVYQVLGLCTCGVTGYGSSDSYRAMHRKAGTLELRVEVMRHFN